MKILSVFIFVILAANPLAAADQSAMCDIANKMLEESPQDVQRQVTCIDRDPQGHIFAIGGPWGKVYRDQAIQQIESQTYYYYVIKKGQKILLVVNTDFTLGKSIQLCSDDPHDNTLNQLPPCTTPLDT